MKTTELKKLAEAVIKNPDDMKTWRKWEAHTTPPAILKLLQINAELVEMVKEAAVLADFAECWITDPAIEGMSRLKGRGDKFRAALAKAEGGEL